MSTNVRHNNTSRNDMVTIVYRFRDSLKNIGQLRKITLLIGKRNSSWKGLFRITI